jgi:hypothetical protein
MLLTFCAMPFVLAIGRMRRRRPVATTEESAVLE